MTLFAKTCSCHADYRCKKQTEKMRVADGSEHEITVSVEWICEKCGTPLYLSTRGVAQDEDGNERGIIASRIPNL